ncbi:hypothetical protein ACWEWB_10230 [Staphylococcus xylosus]|uniref:hypothetical protein n=1 Tax=Staphylococcus xylosus TaxID=1288 RepID=UPI000D1D3434|nr:hypothetical protein BU099_06280 [Staphylococcus xylosus]PTI50231.1 hypothetical protein BU111_10700 [Staphylococcus xylosus]PTI56149.1 hypothetical protein BU106_00335 [Staphylococcus xylosus]
MTGKGAVVVKISKTVAKSLAAVGVSTSGAAISLLAGNIPGWGKIAGVLGATAATTLVNQVTQNAIKGGAWVKIGLKSKKVLGVG